ncbi:MAG: aldo/keto reductase [Treponema sp.]|jgi:diketogulonate reductase-like aldo/keto reductase|nr:aldo/keto reductase [Treponema sp.]
MSVPRSFTLANRLQIPSTGYGTWQIPFGEETEKAVGSALAAGFRHIDTAAAYGNDFSVAAAVNSSGIARKDIFISGKLWINKRGYDAALKAFKQTLKRFNMDYLDLFLIHWPAAPKVYENWKELNDDTWRAFQTLYNDGLVRAVGVSNFTPFYLAPLLEKAEIVPMVNQIEYHPGFMQKETAAFCQGVGILIEAWSPLGSGRILMRKELLNIAEKYGRSSAQICIRWCLQNGVLPISRSVNPERIKENAAVFDFELPHEDMAVINALPDFGGSGDNPDDFEANLKETPQVSGRML